MIRFRLDSASASQQYLLLSGWFPHDGSPQLILQLSAWRPGRYELGNFAKNMRGFKAFDSASGRELICQKSTKDCWIVEAEHLQEVEVRYAYFSNEFNAGSTFIDEDFLYVNPVNCFLYCPQQLNQSYAVELPDWPGAKLACGLKAEGRTLFADHFDALADAPFMYSSSLTCVDYQVDEWLGHIWIHGQHHLSTDQLIADFVRFTQANFSVFHEAPCAEYHFLLLLPDFAHRHGVEHRNSTVIVMGPGLCMHEPEAYQDLLAISCHELFHTWNVKDFRPEAMTPYHFERENYSELGYIYEGLTTYYGDYLLWRAGIFSDVDWLQSLQSHGEGHVWNGGRFHQSVATSSVDTWLDGYVVGAPHRKVSIYNEGYWIACFIDLLIRRNSDHQLGLDHVMRRLYHQFGGGQAGLNRTAFWDTVVDLGGDSLRDVERLAHTASDYFPMMQKLLQDVGVACRLEPGLDWPSAHLGMQVDRMHHRWVVLQTWYGGPADLAGIHRGDELVLPENFTADQWPSFFANHGSADFEVKRAPQKYVKKIHAQVHETIHNRLVVAKDEQHVQWARWRQAPGSN